MSEDSDKQFERQDHLLAEKREIEVFASPREVLQMYGEWFILLCMRYMRQSGDHMLNENGGYAPKSVSMAKILASLICILIDRFSASQINSYFGLFL